METAGPEGQPPPLGTPAAEGAVPCAIGKGIDADREARGAGVLVTNRVGDWERSRLLVLGRAWLRSDSMVDWLVQWGVTDRRDRMAEMVNSMLQHQHLHRND